MGAATLDELARRNVRVCGLEQFDRGHRRGSSHGRHRVFRKAYFEHPDYVPLLCEAERIWKQLEAECGIPLYDRRGVVVSGPPDSEPVTGTLQAADAHGLAVHVLSPAAARTRWPMLMFPDSHRVVVDPDAGILAVEECVNQLLVRAERHGARLCWNTPVASWSFEGDQAVVTTVSGDTFRAERAVITGGAWAGTFLADELPPLTVRHKLQVWYEADAVSRNTLTGLPAFFFETERGSFYGMPSGAGEIKLARHSGGPVVQDPGSPGTGADAEDGPVAWFANRFLKGLSPRPVYREPCLYTMSPDSHFLIDRHSRFDHVVYGAAFSGHGFKFAGVIGRILADLVLDGRTDLPAEFLSAGRFRGSDPP